MARTQQRRTQLQGIDLGTSLAAKTTTRLTEKPMQRQLAVVFAAGLFVVCRDSVPPVAPVADVMTGSADHGPPPEYQPIALQLPGDYTRGLAVAINNHGQVVAYTQTLKDGLLESSRAFLWDDGTIQDLGALGQAHTVPTDINDRGQV